MFHSAYWPARYFPKPYWPQSTAAAPIILVDTHDGAIRKKRRAAAKDRELLRRTIRESMEPPGLPAPSVPPSPSPPPADTTQSFEPFQEGPGRDFLDRLVESHAQALAIDSLLDDDDAAIAFLVLMQYRKSQMIALLQETVDALETWLFTRYD